MSAREVGWYRWDCDEATRAASIGFEIEEDEYPYFIVHWNGEEWDIFELENYSCLPLGCTSASLAVGGHFSDEALLALMTLSAADNMPEYTLLDYLLHFPSTYESITVGPAFDRAHLDRWLDFEKNGNLKRPDLRFAELGIPKYSPYMWASDLPVAESTRLDVDHLWIDSDDEVLQTVGVIGIRLNDVMDTGVRESTPGDDATWEYMVYAELHNRRRDDAVFPTYSQFTSAESFVLSNLIYDQLQVKPLPLRDLTASEHRVLQRDLLVIHRPDVESLHLARDQDFRNDVFDRMVSAYGEPKMISLVVDDDPRLNVFSHDAAERRFAHIGPTFPDRRLVKTFEEAELYSAEVMHALGFRNVSITPPGSDEGIDVISDEAIAQVKMEGVKTSREKLQRLTGVCSVYGKRAVFFSLSGYTMQALEWAEKTGMACFEFAFDGSIVPGSAYAIELAERGVCRTS
ncbi:restriction endonuclease [Brevibacterium yomogidense]|uniref:restriction endonuclease n=1 Tax=Brevibacterium yomogidense TaxID=946573 RepID=UPI0018E00987|nr:restriction endonuclease [Brevibacterium yomogidense]